MRVEPVRDRKLYRLIKGYSGTLHQERGRALPTR